MKTQTKKFIAYLNLLGEKIDGREFESRIKAQKLAYITQKITGKALYEFNFYIRGPYSKELAREYFDFREEFLRGDSGDSKISKEESEDLVRVKPLLTSLNQKDLEIVASLLYLKDKGLDEDQAEIKLKELKPHLKSEDIWRGSNIIKKLFLTEKLRAAIMSSLVKETDEWDTISNESLRKFE